MKRVKDMHHAHRERVHSAVHMLNAVQCTVVWFCTVHSQARSLKNKYNLNCVMVIKAVHMHTHFSYCSQNRFEQENERRKNIHSEHAWTVSDESYHYIFSECVNVYVQWIRPL